MLERAIQMELLARTELYRYAKLNLLDTPPIVIFNPVQKAVSVVHYFHNDPTKMYGECVELAMAVSQWLRDAHPELDALFCQGNEPEHFPSKDDNHCYLLVGKAEHLDVFEQGNRDERRQASQSIYVVDPSFHRVTSFLKSHYKIRELGNTIIRPRDSDAAAIPLGHALPLGLAKNGSILSIVPLINQGTPRYFVGVSGKKIPFAWHHVQSETVSTIRRDNPELSAMVESFLGAETYVTDQPIPDTNPKLSYTTD